MPLPMNYSRNLPRSLDLDVLKERISTGVPVVVRLHYDDASDNMTVLEIRAWAEQRADELAYFLWNYVDPFVLDALINRIVKDNKDAGKVEYLDWDGNPFEKKVEVPLRFHVLDPAHPCYGKTGEMLYAEGEDGPYYLWIDSKAVRVEKHQIEKKV